MTEAAFWASTPFLTRLFCDAEERRDRNRYRHDLFVAFHAAWYERQKRLGKQDLLRDLKQIDKSAKRQSPDEIVNIVEHLNAAFGGVDRRKKKPVTNG